MSFGQQSGPPASGRDVKRLLELLQDSGYDGFRDARGPLGFTQRQGGGKFTRDEATAFIEQLETAAEGGDDPTAPAVAVEPARRLTAAERQLRGVPADQLAAELQRRGWIVIEP